MRPSAPGNHRRIRETSARLSSRATTKATTPSRRDVTGSSLAVLADSSDKPPAFELVDAVVEIVPDHGLAAPVEEGVKAGFEPILGTKAKNLVGTARVGEAVS